MFNSCSSSVDLLKIGALTDNIFKDANDNNYNYSMYLLNNEHSTYVTQILRIHIYF